MLRFWLALAAVIALGCSTHEVDGCLPPCGASDQIVFAQCVANGTAICRAGNRACCATRAVSCLGQLDDQTVRSRMPDCELTVLTADHCGPVCDAEATGFYDLCLTMGAAACPVGDPECCALAPGCLGTVGEYYVVREGCCDDAIDCPAGNLCNESGMCAPGPGCGDGVQQTTEGCDDGNQFTEHCAYGDMDCEVCDSICQYRSGSFCGDGTTDPELETCDPPDGTTCDAECQEIGASTCSNKRRDGDETGLDCGGSCPRCYPGSGCLSELDCQSSETCTTAVCNPDTMLCEETYPCDDFNTCTHESCAGATGCMSTPIDDDGDDFGPGRECGGDCDDLDPAISPGADEICDDGVDQNCNDVADEGCPT